MNKIARLFISFTTGLGLAAGAAMPAFGAISEPAEPAPELSEAAEETVDAIEAFSDQLETLSEQLVESAEAAQKTQDDLQKTRTQLKNLTKNEAEPEKTTTAKKTPEDKAAAQENTQSESTTTTTTVTTTVIDTPEISTEDPVEEEISQAGATIDNPWVITYYVDIDAPEADNSGLITMIKPEGYFEAHRWSANGQKIASMPEYIEIDGQEYEFADYRIGSYLEAGDYYPSWWRPFWNHDGYVGLQTCDGDSDYLVLAYRPI